MIKEDFCICLPEHWLQTLAPLWTKGLADLSLFMCFFIWVGGDCELTWPAHSAIEEYKNYLFPLPNSHCNFIFSICTVKAAGGRQINPVRGMGLLGECSWALSWKLGLIWLSYEPWRATIYSCVEYDCTPIQRRGWLSYAHAGAEGDSYRDMTHHSQSFQNLCVSQ